MNIILNKRLLYINTRIYIYVKKCNKEYYNS